MGPARKGREQQGGRLLTQDRAFLTPAAQPFAPTAGNRASREPCAGPAPPRFEWGWAPWSHHTPSRPWAGCGVRCRRGPTSELEPGAAGRGTQQDGGLVPFCGPGSGRLTAGTRGQTLLTGSRHPLLGSVLLDPPTVFTAPLSGGDASER